MPAKHVFPVYLPAFQLPKRESCSCANRWRTLQWREGAFIMALIPEFRRSTLPAATLALLGAMALTVSGASPARADRCDDLATQLKGQIDGLKVGITAARVIYLSHPLAKELSLGCAGRKFSIELYAKANGRKPKPEFLEFVASAAALVFSLPKDEMLKGV